MLSQQQLIIEWYWSCLIQFAIFNQQHAALDIIDIQRKHEGQ